MPQPWVRGPRVQTVVLTGEGHPSVEVTVTRLGRGASITSYRRQLAKTFPSRTALGGRTFLVPALLPHPRRWLDAYCCSRSARRWRAKLVAATVTFVVGFPLAVAGVGLLPILGALIVVFVAVPLANAGVVGFSARKAHADRYVSCVVRDIDGKRGSARELLAALIASQWAGQRLALHANAPQGPNRETRQPELVAYYQHLGFDLLPGEEAGKRPLMVRPATRAPHQ